MYAEGLAIRRINGADADGWLHRLIGSNDSLNGFRVKLNGNGGAKPFKLKIRRGTKVKL